MSIGVTPSPPLLFLSESRDSPDWLVWRRNWASLTWPLPVLLFVLPACRKHAFSTPPCCRVFFGDKLHGGAYRGSALFVTREASLPSSGVWHQEASCCHSLKPCCLTAISTVKVTFQILTACLLGLFLLWSCTRVRKGSPGFGPRQPDIDHNRVVPRRTEDGWWVSSEYKEGPSTNCC